MDTLVSRSKLKNVSTLGEYATVVKDVSKDKLGEAKDRFALSVRDEVCIELWLAIPMFYCCHIPYLVVH